MKLASLVGLAARLPTVVRTLRPLRAEQLAAQLRHTVVGNGPPCAVRDDDATLAIERPAAVYLPPPAHVRALGGDRFELLATAFSIPRGPAWSARSEGPLFAYHLHQHEWLRLPGLAPASRFEILADWIRANPGGIGWDPHPTGLRLLAWGKLWTSPGLLPPESGDAPGMLASYVDQAETLSQRLEVRLQANHLLSNLLCVVFAGLLVESRASAGWRARASMLVRELERQVHPDGGHEERSPMYHAALLEGVLDLLNLCRAAPQRAPEGLAAALETTAARMLKALAILTHPDGRIALVADSAFDIAAEPAALHDYASRLGVAAEPPGERGAQTRSRSARLRDTGYLRLEAGDWSLLASVAGPAPAHQPGHAHCDALAFELCLGERRLVADTGVFEYVPGARRHRARTTASHATLQLDAAEQAEIWAAHRVGGRPEVRVEFSSEARSAEAPAASEAVATCRGWSMPAALHRRRFRVDEAAVEIEDAVEGPYTRVESRIPLAPGWSVEITGGPGARVARCRSQDGSPAVVEIELPAPFEWRCEEAPYYPSFGREATRPMLVGTAVGVPITAARMRFRVVG